MIIKYFKVKLLTDIVLNAALNTEGNMQTLDYIPGSNFLGIVAGKLYKELNAEFSYDIFHSGKVSFGDALISKNNAMSYAMPFSLFQDKLNNEITKDPIWLHHAEKIPSDIQPKQVRSGYFNTDNSYIKKVEKKFSLKSAHNRKERRSEEGKMFGFESIRKGQEFIFSITFEDENYVDQVVGALIGNQRIGKSKTAQFGKVAISEIEKTPEVFSSNNSKNNLLIIYAESNLCFVNEWGQATYQPTAGNFGAKGTIRWDLSQIRTHSYSPWNGQRNTTSTQRDCILKGSVIVIETDKNDVSSLPPQVGEYRQDGLGRVIYNPDFLQADAEGKWNMKLEKYKEEETSFEKSPINTALGKLLTKKKAEMDADHKIGKAILKAMEKYKDDFKKVTRSQWGVIRQYASEYKKVDELMAFLFGSDTQEGLLNKGVAAERIWDKNGNRNKLQKILIDNRGLGTRFIAKFAAEMAKK